MEEARKITLKDARVSKGMSISFVSKQIGVSSKTLLRYESQGGKVPCDIAVMLKSIYNIESINKIEF